MIRQAVYKHLRILMGWWRTRTGRTITPYRSSWWDSEFYPDEINDRNTIYAGGGLVQSSLHYASVETIILPMLQRQRLARVIDIGSGAGHWIRFYRQFASEVIGCEVSHKCLDHLREQGFDVKRGPAVEILPHLGRADVVNAIGVMFHIVDDPEWEQTIRLVSDALNPGGLFVVGGHFGLLDGANLQVCRDGTVNKRLRSARHWRRALEAAGFEDIRIVRNRAYLKATEPLPENNILFARKPAD